MQPEKRSHIRANSRPLPRSGHLKIILQRHSERSVPRAALAGGRTDTYVQHTESGGGARISMGLLDELEKEAQLRRAEEDQLKDQRALRESQWQDMIEPKMHELEAYLRQLTEKLGFLKRRTRVSYSLPTYGEVVAYVDPSYKLVAHAPTKTSYEIKLDFAAVVASEECPQIQGESGTRLKSLIGVLQQLRLNGMTDVRKNANGEITAARIQAKGKVPMSMVISADQESGMIRMGFTNMEGMAQSSRSFRAEQVDSGLMDSLGRFVAREETGFAQEAVAEDLRRQLKTRIQAESIKREWETKLSRQLGADEANALDSLDPSVRPGSLLGRIKLLSRRLIGR